MFTSIDRFVLSQVEKCTQTLHRYFGIKISTIINLCASVVITCIFMGWYFTGTPSPFSLVLQGIVVLSLLRVIFVDSKNYQAEAEARSARGVSNPFKIVVVVVVLRLVLFFFSGLLILIFISLASTQTLINLIYTLSFWMYVCAFSVDVLPPSDNKAGALFKSLFRKRSLST